MRESKAFRPSPEPQCNIDRHENELVRAALRHDARPSKSDVGDEAGSLDLSPRHDRTAPIKTNVVEQILAESAPACPALRNRTLLMMKVRSFGQKCERGSLWR